jgi:TRIAD3 protein (E3 ubiquitin-protein ligase RNF216)
MNLSAHLRLANVMESMITNGDYPKQQKQPLRKKRRLEDEVEENIKVWETDKREVAPVQLKGTIAAMLKADFPEIPKQQIAHEVARHKHLYQTYLALARLKDTDDGSKKWRGRASLSDLATADTIATNCGWAPMTEELKAARARVKDIRRQRVIDEVNKKAEQENLQRAIDNNETSECQVCFDDLPMNRQIHCDGPVAHFTCFSCAELYIKTEVGDARCRVECTAGCGAAFKRSQLYMLSDKPLLAKLEKLQQEKDIRDAGLEGLEECPMCIDFKIILGPIEEDSEFRCGNPECEQVSCRRCKAASHIPLSCEEHAKENKISTRHRIEERMTEALIRSCNKCKKKFIKDFGCNKMVSAVCFYSPSLC